jgi:hypothetical protein
MNLGALDSISAHLVSYAEIRERSPVSISTISKRQVDRLNRFPVRMKQALLRELEWLRRLSAVRHWVHDVFIFNTGVTLATTSSIRIEPGVCPKVEHMEGYFFPPFFITFIFNSSTPCFSFLIFSFFQSYLRTSNSNLLQLSLGRSLRLWRIIGRFFLTLVTL